MKIHVYVSNMGIGTSKLRVRHRLGQREAGQRSLSAIKNDVEGQMDDCRFSDSLIAKDGVSFFKVFGSGKPKRIKPHLSSEPGEIEEVQAHNAFTACEREIMADIIVEEQLRHKVKTAHVNSKRLDLVVSRNEKYQQELKAKIEDKMRNMTFRRQLLLDRMRPSNNNKVMMHFANHRISLVPYK